VVAGVLTRFRTPSPSGRGSALRRAPVHFMRHACVSTDFTRLEAAQVDQSTLRFRMIDIGLSPTYLMGRLRFR
jgi:hypothetical protein